MAFETYFISEDEATEMLRSEAPLDDDEAFDEEIDENGSVDLGELVAQGKNNLHAPWLGLTAFFSLAILLSLVTFVGEAVRDAFDPRKAVAHAAPAAAENAAMDLARGENIPKRQADIEQDERDSFPQP